MLERAEDRSGDGKADFTAYFEGGVPRRLEVESAGKGCIDLRQWLDAKGKVTAEEKDTTGSCKIDTWSDYEAGKLVRQGRDPDGRGHATVLSHFDTARASWYGQELISGQGTRPDKKLFIAARTGTSAGNASTPTATASHGAALPLRAGAARRGAHRFPGQGRGGPARGVRRRRPGAPRGRHQRRPAAPTWCSTSRASRWCSRTRTATSTGRSTRASADGKPVALAGKLPAPGEARRARLRQLRRLLEMSANRSQRLSTQLSTQLSTEEREKK